MESIGPGDGLAYLSDDPGTDGVQFGVILFASRSGVLIRMQNGWTGSVPIGMAISLATMAKMLELPITCGCPGPHLNPV